MFSPVRLLAIFTSLLFSVLANAQYFPSMLQSGPVMQTGSVNGTVLGPRGEPIAGARVELSSVNSFLPIASAYTQESGTFELYNIPAGSYQVIAYAYNSQVRDVVTVNFGSYSVELRIPQSAADAYHAAATISVAQMMVPEKARGYYVRALNAFIKNKDDEAGRQVAKALKVYPHFAQALTLRGLIARKADTGDRGQQDFEESIQADPHYSVAYFALGSLYNGQGHYDDALRTLEEGVTLSPNAWQGYFEMAKALIAKGMFAKGLQLATKAEQLGGSSFAAIHLMKAYAMIPLKAYKGAQQELRAFLAREPNGKSAQQAEQLLAKVTAAEAAEAGLP